MRNPGQVKSKQAEKASGQVEKLKYYMQMSASDWVFPIQCKYLLPLPY